MIPWLEDGAPFPSVATALTEQDGAAGLLAAGAELNAERLLEAYLEGIFPWFSDGEPVLWWSPDPRMVLMTDDFVMRDSLRKKLRQCGRNPHIHFTFDNAFTRVMQACAEPRISAQGRVSGTWITSPIIAAYTELHQRGFAHSCEMWQDGQLVGGLYGVALGRMFYGESMFARVTDASKMALALSVHFLRQNGVKMIDCQQQTNHLASLGGKAISRQQFIQHIHHATQQAEITNWTITPELIQTATQKSSQNQRGQYD